MALGAQLNALLVPNGTEFPGTVQELLQLIAEYEEIVGLQDFNGVNYGTVEPDPADRDKAWLRTDGGGNFLGWYVWTGSAWTILPAKAFYGTSTERDALLNPQEGYMWQVAGTGLYVYNGSSWEASFPSASEDLVGDKFYFFPSAQSLINTGSAVPTWTAIDLASYISTSGIPQENILAAIVRLDGQLGPVGFGGGVSFDVQVRVWGDDSISTSATDIAYLFVSATRDDSNTSASGTTQAFVPMDDQADIYYNVGFGNAPAGANAKVWLVGFIYTPFAT